MTKSIYRIPYRYPIFHIDTHIDVSLISDIPYRYPISIFHIHIDIPMISCHSGRDIEIKHSAPRSELDLS